MNKNENQHPLAGLLAFLKSIAANAKDEMSDDEQKHLEKLLSPKHQKLLFETWFKQLMREKKVAGLLVMIDPQDQDKINVLVPAYIGREGATDLLQTALIGVLKVTPVPYNIPEEVI